MGFVQHKTGTNYKKPSIIVGGMVDISPQDYVAENTNVIYEADIINCEAFFSMKEKLCKS